MALLHSDLTRPKPRQPGPPTTTGFAASDRARTYASVRRVISVLSQTVMSSSGVNSVLRPFVGPFHGVLDDPIMGLALKIPVTD